MVSFVTKNAEQTFTQKKTTTNSDILKQKKINF